MKNKRNYLLYILVSMLLICLPQVRAASAAASPSLSASADSAGVTKGSYVNVSVNLSGNPSISTLGAALSYDSSVLKYVSTSWNGSFSGSDMKMASDTGSAVNLSVVCDSSYSADGTAATVRFQAVSDSSSIPVTLSLRDMADADLDAVTDCKVSSRVRVPETAGSKNDAADKKDSTVNLKSQETGNTDKTEGTGTSGKQAAGTINTDTGNAQSTSNIIAVNTQKIEASAGTGSAKPDQNYKTGAGIGSDIFLVIAAACGILAFVLAVRKQGEEKK